ncbi:hypothetical protein BGX38DRAFT_1152324, partial [Terfezia claveryi]
MAHANRLAWNYFAPASEDPVPFPNGRNAGVELRRSYAVALDLMFSARGTLHKILEEARQYKQNQEAGIPHKKLHFTVHECRSQITFHQVNFVGETQNWATQFDGLEQYVDQNEGAITDAQRQFIKNHGRKVNSTMLGVYAMLLRLRREFVKCFGEPFQPF